MRVRVSESIDYSSTDAVAAGKKRQVTQVFLSLQSRGLKGLKTLVLVILPHNQLQQQL